MSIESLQAGWGTAAAARASRAARHAGECLLDQRRAAGTCRWPARVTAASCGRCLLSPGRAWSPLVALQVAGAGLEYPFAGVGPARIAGSADRDQFLVYSPGLDRGDDRAAGLAPLAVCQ